MRGDSEQRARIWGRSLMFGVTTGLGSPGGVLGAQVQINPSRFWGVSWGGGAGLLGAAMSMMVWGRPLVLPGDSNPVVGVGVSANWIPDDERSLSGRRVPVTARWLDVEIGREWRFLSGRTVRLGLGHSWLLNRSQFGCAAGDNLCSAASESVVPGWAFYNGGVMKLNDIIVASRSDRSVHLWFAHLDLGGVIPFLTGLA